MKTSNLSLDQAPPEDVPFRYMLSAPVFGILAGILLAVRGSDLYITAWSHQSVGLVHLMTLGWLATIMMGAFYQMVPVLVGGHVPWIKLSKWNYYLIISGILFLVAGFLTWQPVLLKMAPVFLGIGLSIFVVQLLTALFKMKANRPVVYAMRISIISLFLGAATGILMLGVLFGWWPFPLDGYSLKYIHITFLILGWVTLLIVGVGFHVIPMFYLTEPFPDKTGYTVISLVLTSIVMLVFFIGFKLNAYWILIAGLPAAVGILLFSYTITKLLFKRQRKMMDVTLKFWIIGLFSLVIAVILSPFDIFRIDEVFAYLIVGLFLFGFAGGISNGMLYKIVPFLVWLHRFSSLVGKIKTPSMKDIIGSKPATRQFYLYWISVVMIIGSSIVTIDWVVRSGGVIWGLSSLYLWVLLIKAVRVIPPEAPPAVEMDDFAAMFKDLPPPPAKP